LIGRPLEVGLTEDSGIAGLIFLVKQHTGHEPSKDNPDLRRVHDPLNEACDAGRQIAVEWGEVAQLVGDATPKQGHGPGIRSRSARAPRVRHRPGTVARRRPSPVPAQTRCGSV